MIRGTCPVCGRTFKVDDRYAGMTGKCRTCGGSVTVPGEPDEGLDGLPSVPDSAQQDEPQQAQEQEPAPAAAAPPAGAAAAQPRPRPEPAAAPPESPAQEAPQPQPAAEAPDEGHPRDTYEPNHGPTAVQGHWLKDQPDAHPEAPEPEAPAPEAPAPEAPSRVADQVLGSARMLTTIDTTDTGGRPLVLTLACIVLGLLGVGFCLKVAAAGVPGATMAGIGIVLVAVAVFRLWTHHWDGLIPAFLFCLGVAGAVVLLSYAALEEGEAFSLRRDTIALLAGAGLGILLLLSGLLRESVRDYLTG